MSTSASIRDWAPFCRAVIDALLLGKSLPGILDTLAMDMQSAPLEAIIAIYSVNDQRQPHQLPGRSLSGWATAPRRMLAARNRHWWQLANNSKGIP